MPQANPNAHRHRIPEDKHKKEEWGRVWFLLSREETLSPRAWEQKVASQCYVTFTHRTQISQGGSQVRILVCCKRTTALRRSTHPQPQLVTGLFLRAGAVLGPVQNTGAGMEPPSASCPQVSKGDGTVIKVENDHCQERCLLSVTHTVATFPGMLPLLLREP